MTFIYMGYIINGWRVAENLKGGVPGRCVRSVHCAVSLCGDND